VPALAPVCLQETPTCLQGRLPGEPRLPAFTEPWPEAEQELVARRPALVAASSFTAAHLAEVDAADEAAGNVIAALIQQQEPPEQAMQLLMTNHHQGPHPSQQQPLLGGAGGEASLHHQADSTQQSPGVATGIAELQLQQQREAAQITARAARLQSRRVIKIMKGQGHVAGHGYQNPGWVQGRLWVYEDATSKEITCGFLFIMDDMLHLVDLERLDDDL